MYGQINTIKRSIEKHINFRAPSPSRVIFKESNREIKSVGEI